MKKDRNPPGHSVSVQLFCSCFSGALFDQCFRLLNFLNGWRGISCSSFVSAKRAPLRSLPISRCNGKDGGLLCAK